MCDRFIKFIPSEEAFWLMHNKPNAFRLLTHIANTARRTPGHPDGILIGQCHLEHWKQYDLTEQEYRTAKQILVNRKHIVIISTRRHPQKSTNKSTTNSTLVQLCSNTIWDINPKVINDSINDQSTINQRSINDKQEVKKVKKEKEEEEKIARTAARPHTKSAISFDFDSFEFLGITEKDKNDWKIMYPFIDVPVEILKAATWLKANPSKSRKKNWLKYLTSWLSRGNDTSENKKAYRSALGNNTQDKRTKDIAGNPIDSAHTGRF